MLNPMTSYLIFLCLLGVAFAKPTRFGEEKSPLYPLVDFFVDVALFAPLNDTSFPQVFHQEGIIVGKNILENIVLDLERKGIHCTVNDYSVNEYTVLCNPFGYDTIESRCLYDNFGILYCSTIVYNRVYDYSFQFKFRNQKSCQKPQVWKRVGAKINLDLQGEPMDIFLAELNEKGYECTGDYNTFSCAHPIPYDTVKGSCLGTMSVKDPVKCKVDKIYNHFTLKKILPCCYPGENSCKE